MECERAQGGGSSELMPCCVLLHASPSYAPTFGMAINTSAEVVPSVTLDPSDCLELKSACTGPRALRLQGRKQGWRCDARACEPASLQRVQRPRLLEGGAWQTGLSGRSARSGLWAADGPGAVGGGARPAGAHLRRGPQAAHHAGRHPGRAPRASSRAARRARALHAAHA